jgi:uncharacterized repeat protein (TIGR01451 family)
MKSFARILAGVSCLLCAGQVFAAVGGGATIHNAATLSFNGGQVTAHVDVTVDTVASAPIFDVDNTNIDINPGDNATFNYTITNTSNGSDNFSLAVSSSDTDVTAPTALGITPATVTLGASIASAPSDASGNVFIPAGSQTNLQVGDRVVINISGSDYVYQIDTLTPGTPASTTGNTTTAETPTSLTLSGVTPGAPVIGAGDVAAGTQIGEQQSFTVQITGGTPDTPGTDGSHQIDITGNTSAQDSSGSVVGFDDTVDATATVLSGDANLVKEVRNVTEGGGFATSGVTAQTGDVLEYRLTATPVAGSNVTGATLTDTLPQYTGYVTSSTTLNGAAVADAGGTPFPLDEGGISVNSPGGAAGEILDGESAVVIFQVTVD